MPSKALLVFLACLASQLGFGQDSTSSWYYTMHYSLNRSFSEADPLYSPRQFEGQVDRFTAIPIDQFEDHGEEWRIPESSYSATLGLFGDFNSSALSMQLGFSEVHEKTKNAKLLRFTDQIEGSRGFVQPSIYQVKNIHVVSYLLTGRVIAWQKINIGGLQSRIGVGAIGYQVLKSNYQLHLQDLEVGNFYRYEARDVAWNDLVFNASFEIHFEVLLPPKQEYAPYIVHVSFVPVGAYFSGLQLKNQFPEQYRTWLNVGVGYQIPSFKN